MIDDVTNFAIRFGPAAGSILSRDGAGLNPHRRPYR